MPDDNETKTIRDFLEVAAATGVPTLTVGANARTLVFDVHHGLQARRRTLDWDFAARFGSWAGYRAFAERLQAEGVFKAGTAPHRFVHTGTGIPIDVVPFGGLADAQGKLVWPETEQEMSVRGFEAAFEYAERIDLAGEEMRVATPAWHVALKLAAYADRRAEKDLSDLNYILEHATNAFSERVFDELAELLADDLSYDEAGPYLIGQDLAKQAPPETAVELLNVLSGLLDEPNQLELRRHLLKFPTSDHREAELKQIVARFAALRRGIGSL